MMCMKIKYSVYFINEIEQYTPSALDPDPLDNYRIRRPIKRNIDLSGETALNNQRN